MPQCAVVGCNSSHRKTKGGSIRYHRFPGDSATRARWVQACGKYVQNCSTARICSRHFTDDSYERDVQHELLGLPTRCRLKKGATPDRNLPMDFLKEETLPDSAIAILLAVGLVPTAKMPRQISGGLPQDLTKMQIMEDVREGCSVQPSSPGHAEERLNSDDKQTVEPEENGFEEEGSVGSNQVEEAPKKDADSEEAKEDKPAAEVENGETVKGENNLEANNVNEESCSNTSSEEAPTKRKSESQDSANKRLRMDIQDNFISRDKILNEFIEMADCGSVEQLQMQTEQILAEIRTLNELAKEKEREWNNIIHLKKMKEELLLRMQRRKQVMLVNSDKNENGEVLFGESQTDCVGERLKNSSNQSILKANLTNPNKTLRVPGSGANKHRNILPKPQQYSQEMNGSLDYRQNKQRPVLDVQSIIADYRQRHPEIVPRRGRRIRNSHPDGKNSNNHILNFSSLALGSGSQVHHNVQGLDVNSELGILLNAMDASRNDSSRPSSAESSTPHEPSFKDMLVQFAKLSQSERHELIQNAIKPPPPYPEVTVHPVPTTNTVAPTNSLLHGILTKSPSKANTKTSFSPTLARLLTAPERGNSHSPTTAAIANNLNNAANMSISEILSTSKARNEITITPVGTQYEAPHKGKAAQDEDEAEDSADRLVIDESSEVLDGRGRGDNSSDAGDEVPQCQGCNQKSALFVCAGCGNQWYCSRDCQVSAWDEHSEVCSG
ncbi:uncharacterized protein [Tenebrio molitor]|uniref:uncharacterized protein isoform X3 n=1 Tax=Tenebrio molitor TaxID=7067 RepID=UPI003624AB49